ncbi:MAG: bifunctional nuclease family protein [Candidatus Neomarinimicrobiota bacterium]|nr:bifunctional nuclease family protein [Candidatus Neomarinimicrobiota bacterium]
MVPVKVQKISFHPPSRSYAVILSEINGERKLPVIVGSFEAQSIALALEAMETPRPLTHDLIGLLINEIDANLVAVRITNIEDGVFYASLDINSEITGKRSIDSRPSDAIAVGLRMKAPIMISDELFEEAGLSESNYETGQNSENVLSVKDLEDRLQIAVDNEKYEVAAKIRDQINELKE